MQIKLKCWVIYGILKYIGIAIDLFFYKIGSTIEIELAKLLV